MFLMLLVQVGSQLLQIGYLRLEIEIVHLDARLYDMIHVESKLDQYPEKVGFPLCVLFLLVS